VYIPADLHRCLSHVRTSRNDAATRPIGKMSRGQPCARKRPPQSSEHARSSQRHGWRRRLKSATSATAVYCPDESCLTVLNSRGRYQQRLAWDWPNSERDRINGKFISPAIVSRSGFRPIGSGCLQGGQLFVWPDYQALTMLPVYGGAELDPKVRREPWHLTKAQLILPEAH
jgi:hypothetical protein